MEDIDGFLEIDLSDELVRCDLNGILVIIAFISLLAE